MFTPLSDTSEFQSLQTKRTQLRRQEELDRFCQTENLRIEQVVRASELQLAERRINWIHRKPDWYKHSEEVNNIHSLENAAIEQERLYQGARHKRSVERALRQENERRELEQIRLSRMKAKPVTSGRNPYEVPEGPDLNDDRSGENSMSVKHRLALRKLPTYGSSRACEDRLNGEIKGFIYTSYRGFVEAAAYNDHQTILTLLPTLEAVTEDHWCELLNEALGIAASKGYENIIRTLLEAGGDPNRSHSGSPAVVTCARHGHLSCLQLMLEEFNADIDAQDQNGYTALIQAVGQNHAPVVRYLIACGAARHIKTKAEGYSSLHVAAKNGLLDLLNLLVPMRKMLTSEIHDSISEETPLMMAISHGHNCCISLLASDSIMLSAQDKQGRVALHHAVNANNVEAVRLLIDDWDVDINAPSHAGYTPLILAAKKGFLKMCKILGTPKATAADLSTTDEEDEEQAFRRENPRFFGYGALIDAQDRNHDTALQHAVRNSHTAVVKFLFVELGADPSLENRHMETLIEYIRRMKLVHMEEILRTLHAKRATKIERYKMELHLRAKRKFRRERRRNRGSDSEEYSESSSDEGIEN